MTLQALISKWGSSYTVTRCPETYEDGIATIDEDSDNEFDIIASIQPVTGDALQSLPEGRHAEETRLVFTETELFTARTGYAPDKFSLDGETWEVSKVEHWETWGTAHYRAFITKAVA